MITFILPLLCALAALPAQARLPFGLPEPYQDGPARLAQAQGYRVFDKTPAAKLGYVRVPLDYANPARGELQLFYRLPRPLNPSLPTMLFFYGGPGISSLSALFERSLTGYNLVYFDQRGTGYSYLPTVEQQLNPAHFSSLNTARDAEKLLSELGLARVSVYGHSYGTVVATIFAHLYPERVAGLVLEGTIYNGQARNRANAERIRIMQEVFDRLPEDQRAKVLAYGDGKLVPADWFSRLVKPAMYADNFETSFRKHLAELLGKPASEFASEVNDEIMEFLKSDSGAFGAVMFHQISCQEMALGDPRGGWRARFAGDRLIPAPNADAETCREIPGLAARKKNIYEAARYPLRVPVTYIQGGTDGATPPVGAREHFRQVARGSAQFLTVPNGGHTPATEFLFERPEAEYARDRREWITRLVEQALAGKNLDRALVEKLGWQYRAKAAR